MTDDLSAREGVSNLFARDGEVNLNRSMHLTHDAAAPWLHRGATFRVAGLCAALALVAGCTNDKRISVRELMELEASLSQPVPSKQIQPVASTQPTTLALPEVTKYRVVPGDELSIVVLGMDDLDPQLTNTFELRVRKDGTIQLPYPDVEVKVGELEVQEAEKAIHDALVPRLFVGPLVVTVRILSYQTTTVIVYGEVLQPGPLMLRDDQRSVLYALFGPTGFSPTASGVARVESIRGREHNRRYDLLNPADLRRALTAPPLESGDIIIAEAQTPNVFYFSGLLNGGGQISFAMGQRVTFLQALAAAGGRDPITDPTEGILRRRLSTGEEVEVQLALKDIEKGEEPNFEMRPGDLVMVPHTFRTRALEFLNQSLSFRAGATAAVNYDPLVQDRFNDTLDVQRERNETTAGAFASPGLTGLPDFFVPAFPETPEP